MNATALATATVANINWDTVRRNHIAWLETQVVTLSSAYLAARAAGSADAAELRAAGLAMKARLETAVRAERMGA